MSEKKVCGNLIYHIDEHNFFVFQLENSEKKSFFNFFYFFVGHRRSLEHVQFQVGVQSSN